MRLRRIQMKIKIKGSSVKIDLTDGERKKEKTYVTTLDKTHNQVEAPMFAGIGVTDTSGPKVIDKWLETRKPKVIPAAVVFNVTGDMIGPLSLTGLRGKQICAALG